MINQLYKIIKLVIYFLINFANESNIKRLVKKINNNGDCYILGNGPSILKEISFIQENCIEENLFVVNNFAASDYYQILKPKFYLLTDPDYWTEGVTQEILNLRNIFDLIRTKTTWELNIILPYVGYKKIKNHFKGNKNIHIYFFNHTIINYNRNLILTRKLYLNSACTPRLQNVISGSIFISIILGYKKILLFGVDHSWLSDIIVDNKNRVCWSEKHFYKNCDYKPYIKSNGKNYKLHELLLDYSQVFKSYYVLNKLAIDLKCSIINCTENSYIDAFERLKINKI